MAKRKPKSHIVVEQLSTDVIPFTGSTEKNEDPFHLFLRLLLDRFQKPQVRTMGGAVTWETFPVLEVVLVGLWPLILWAGKQLNMPVTTKLSVDTVSQRLNRLINGGLTLLYPSMNDAIRAFEKEVVQTLTEQLRPVQERTVFEALAQRTTTNFFAAIVKAAREEQKYLKDLNHRILSENRLAEYGFSLTIVEDASFFYDRLIQFLDLNESVPTGNVRNKWHNFHTLERRPLSSVWLTCQTLKTIRARMEKQYRDVHLFKRLAKVMHRLPEGSWSSGQCIDEQWLRTQILLQILGIHDRDYLLQAELAGVLDQVKKESCEDLVNRVLAEIRHRGMKFDEVEEGILRKQIFKDAVRLQRWRRRAINLQTLLALFVMPDFENPVPE